MRTSVAALSCVAHLYWRTATITHSSAMPDKTAMRNTDDIRTPSLSIVLFLTPGEARIRILAEPCDYLSPRIGGVSGNDRSEEHTSELQSLRHLVCRLL